VRDGILSNVCAKVDVLDNDNATIGLLTKRNEIRFGPLLKTVGEHHVHWLMAIDIPSSYRTS
jgi:hypothetical protein